MTLQELLERVEKAEGGDRAIDTALELLLLSATTKEFPGADPRSGLVLILDAKERWVTCDADEYTASIDAAVALVEKMLPGRSWEVREQKQSSFPRAIGGQALIMTMPENETMRGDFSARAKTPALALIAALLRALIAQESKETQA